MPSKPKPYREFGRLLTEGIERFALARRISVGIAHKKLASELGYASNTIYVWQRGEHLPDTKVLVALAQIFAQAWQADQQWINRFLEKGEYEPERARAVLILELFGEKQSLGEIHSGQSGLTLDTDRPIPHPSLGIDFFIGALQSWNENFFRWSNASDHMRSSWAGMVIYAMSAIAERITPGGILVVFIALALWLVTTWLMVPALRWPLDEVVARRMAFIKFGVATLLVPLLVAVVTQPDRYNEFRPYKFKQHLTIWFLKFTGALLGFYTFSIIMIGLTLAWYYFSLPRLSTEVAAILAVIPLFFSYIAARRIPADRYKMFNNNLRPHSADYFFLAVFIVVSPLSALGLYLGYWFLADKTIAPIIILVSYISLALWEYKKQARDDISDVIIILVLGLFVPLGLSILAFFFTPGLSSPSIDELPYLFLALSYILSVTLLGATMLVRCRPTLTLPGVLGLFVIAVLLVLALSVNLWLGRVLVATVVFIWVLWGRKRFRAHFRLHPSGWAMLVAIASSLYIWASALIPPWANLMGFVIVASLLTAWTYRESSDEQDRDVNSITEI